MAVSAVKKLSRKLSFTATVAAGVMTVTTVLTGTSTPTPHYLKSGDVVNFILPETTLEANGKVVTYVDANQFTVPMVGYERLTSSGFVDVGFFSAGQTGDQGIFTIAPSSANQVSIVQMTALGAAGAVLVLSVSNDKIGWVQVATVTLASANFATDFVQIANNWNYGKISITSVGADTAVVVTVAS